MIGRFGEVYLLDWGIAVGLDDRHQGRLRLASRESCLAGTPRFMAPEMAIADGRALGPPTDVYLLGATLFAALVGHPPHQGEDLEALLCGIIDFDPDHPALPRPLVPILRRVMAPDPAERFQTVEALAQDIGRYLGHRDSYRLASRAEEELEGLRASVSQGQVDAVHEAYARVRFACLQTLEIWSDNAEAAATLRAADELAVDHALAQRSAVAARAAAVHLDDPARLAHVEALEVALAREAEELDAFRLDNDPSVAARGRTAFLALMVLSWFIMPILGQLRGGATWSSQVTSSCSVLLFLLAVGGAMRGTLTATEFNRRSAMTLLSIPIGQAVLDTALFVHGVAPQAALSARHALWAVIGLLYALLVAPGLLPSIVVIAIMAVVGAIDPGHAYLWSLVSNVALLTNAVFLWRRR